MQPPSRRTSSSSQRSARPQQVDGTIPEPKMGGIPVQIMHHDFLGLNRVKSAPVNRFT
jgi:hypothetical protein